MTTMYRKRPADARGGGDYGWLNTRHTFSFNDYYDPEYMGFRVLRVINEDRVQPGQGFGTHSHRDMEIVTYVLEGALAHQDSLGTGSVLRPGEC
jgi:quercetin 2,3-dioxygenase